MFTNTSLFSPTRSERIRISPHLDQDGNIVEGLYLLGVCTARGTGPRAAGYVGISEEALSDRRMVAGSVWEARRAAMRFRKNNPPPG